MLRNKSRIDHQSSSEHQQHSSLSPRKQSESSLNLSKQEPSLSKHDKSGAEHKDSLGHGSQKGQAKEKKNLQTRYYYHRSGQLRLQVASRQRLQQRVQCFFTNPSSFQTDEAKNDLQDGRQQGQLPQLHQYRHKRRYYDYIQQYTDNSLRKNKMICGKCGKKGHRTRSCVIHQLRCHNCLGQHTIDKCPAQICRRCGEIGHYNLYCKKEGVKCYKCGKIGHRDYECGAVRLEDRVDSHSQSHSHSKTGRYQAQQEEDLKKVRCMLNCRRGNGHPYCQYDLSKIMSGSSDQGEGFKRDTIYTDYRKKFTSKRKEVKGRQGRLW